MRPSKSLTGLAVKFGHGGCCGIIGSRDIDMECC